MPYQTLKNGKKVETFHKKECVGLQKAGDTRKIRLWNINLYTVTSKYTIYRLEIRAQWKTIWILIAQS